MGTERLDMAEHLWFYQIIHRTSHGLHAVPVRASKGPRMAIYNVFHILWDLCGSCKGAVRHPYGYVRELTQLEFAKIPHGRRMRPYRAHTGPLRSPHGLFRGCLRCLNPYRACKLIMQALKHYGSHMRRQNLIFVQTVRMKPGSVMRLGHYQSDLWFLCRFLYRGSAGCCLLCMCVTCQLVWCTVSGHVADNLSFIILIQQEFCFCSHHNPN